MTEAIQAIVDGVFGGSRPAYNAALAKAGANMFVARAAVADELLRAQIEGALQVPAPTDLQIRLFYSAYANVLIRPFKVAPAAPWLGNRRAGFALAASAPAALFRLPSAVASPFTTGLGSFTVTPMDEALPLGAVPLEPARAGDPNDAPLLRAHAGVRGRRPQARRVGAEPDDLPPRRPAEPGGRVSVDLPAVPRAQLLTRPGVARYGRASTALFQDCP